MIFFVSENDYGKGKSCYTSFKKKPGSAVTLPAGLRSAAYGI